MRQILYVGLLLSTVSLTACHGVAGNVIPEAGPSMEDVYDGVSVSENVTHSSDSRDKTTEDDLDNIRQTKSTDSHTNRTNISTLNSFHKLPNPELQLYIYPHFAGNDQIPIPGYYTEFNVYEKTHYALIAETTR